MIDLIIKQNAFWLRWVKRVFITFVAVIALAGCSKSGGANAESRPKRDPQKADAAKPIDPSRIILVETMEHKERLRIESEAAAFVAAKNFTRLELLADKYRTSRARYPNGVWKLESVYSGTVSAGNATDEEWNARLKTLRDWTLARPDSITARVALAEALVSYGWKVRGNGFANTVTEQGWILFRQRLEEAYQVLNQAGDLKEKCPCSWTVLLRAAVGLQLDKSEYELLFHKAVASEPYCLDYYCQMATYLLPRWHGQRGEAEKFVKQAADQIGGEEGDLFYARLAWHLQNMGGNIFVEDGFTWERADRGFEILEKQFPDSLYVRNARAYIAVMGCEKTLAPRALVEGLDGKIDPAAWTSKENFIRLTRNLYPQ